VNTNTLIAEDEFWLNELSCYQDFLASHKDSSYELFFPEKAYPALRTVYLFETLLPLRNAEILEPGCGMGIILRFLAEKGAYATGLDLSPNAIKHAEIIKNEVPDLGERMQLVTTDFFKFDQIKTYDIVFNSGVLEHFDLNGQHRFLQHMISFSKKYICIIIPNTESPVFQALINKLSGEDRKYEEEHRAIDVEQLFQDNGVDLVLRSGRNLWVTNNDRISDSEVQKIYAKYFSKFNNKVLTQEDVFELARIESEIDNEILFKYSFSQIFVGKVSKS
jgi:SAM-dependent methyltransferase